LIDEFDTCQKFVDFGASLVLSRGEVFHPAFCKSHCAASSCFGVSAFQERFPSISTDAILSVAGACAIVEQGHTAVPTAITTAARIELRQIVEYCQIWGKTMSAPCHLTGAEG
jgi:hypothetical protein